MFRSFFLVSTVHKLNKKSRHPEMTLLRSEYVYNKYGAYGVKNERTKI